MATEMWLNKLEKRLKVAEAPWGLEKLSSPSEPCVEGGRRARKEETFRNYVPSGITHQAETKYLQTSCIMKFASVSKAFKATFSTTFLPVLIEK